MRFWHFLPLTLFLLATTCEQRAIDARVQLADDQIAAAICEVWQPITDTTSPQVRGQNRARYAFCEGELPRVENPR